MATEEVRVLHCNRQGEVNTRRIIKTVLPAHCPGASMRDLRSIINWSNRDICALLVRSRCMIVNFEHIKAVITADYTLVFGDVDNDPVVGEFVKQLSLSLKHRHDVLSETHEFIVLETILSHLIAVYEKGLTLLAPIVSRILQGASDDDVFRLVPLKRSLSIFDVRLKEFASALDDVLESDEDLAAMYLTHKKTKMLPRQVSEHIEAEVMIEEFVKKAEEIRNEINTLQSEIKAIESAVQVSLDTTRNKLMRLNMKISIATLVGTAGTLVAGVYGMNLTNHLEQHPHAFFYVCETIVGLSVLLAIFFALQWRTNISTIFSLSKSSATLALFENINRPQYLHQLDKLDDHELEQVLKGAVGRNDAAYIVTTLRARQPSLYEFDVETLLGYRTLLDDISSEDEVLKTLVCINCGASKHVGEESCAACGWSDWRVALPDEPIVDDDAAADDAAAADDDDDTDDTDDDDDDDTDARFNVPGRV